MKLGDFWGKRKARDSPQEEVEEDELSTRSHRRKLNPCPSRLECKYYLVKRKMSEAMKPR